MSDEFIRAKESAGRFIFSGIADLVKERALDPKRRGYSNN
jgi:hypothetical protein